jgi:two-component system, cell cycle sensor histidine kinase and response regulator CckA
VDHDAKAEQMEGGESVIAAQMAEQSNDMAGGLAGVETILVVEDQAFVRDVTCEVLRSAGYSVLEARHATEAARAYDHHFREVDLLVTDIVLPGENGRVLTERLRRKNPSLRVLLISGYPEQMAPQEKGSEEYLAKPFSTTALLRRVRELLDRGPLGTEGSSMDGETGASSSSAD